MEKFKDKFSKSGSSHTIYDGNYNDWKPKIVGIDKAGTANYVKQIGIIASLGKITKVWFEIEGTWTKEPSIKQKIINLPLTVTLGFNFFGVVDSGGIVRISGDELVFENVVTNINTFNYKGFIEFLAK